MDSFIGSILSYPFSHISQIKKLTSQQLYLKKSSLYPAYPFFLITSAISNLILSVWIIYFFIHSDIHSCYSGVTLGIQILACIFPLYQLMMYLILLVAVAKAQYFLMRIIILLCFTIILTSFGFGGLGVVFSCIVHSQDPTAIPSTFLTQNYFIQIIVYAMLVFVLLYLTLVPISVWLEDRRDKNKQRTGCQTCLFTLYIIFQIFLFIGFVVFIAIAIGGIPVLFYLLNGITKTHPMVQQAFFGIAISCLVSPYGVFVIVLAFTKIFGCGRQEQMSVLDESKQMRTQPQDNLTHFNHNDSLLNRNDSLVNESILKRNTINLDQQLSTQKNSKRQVLLDSHQNKDFAQQHFISRKSETSKNVNKSSYNQ